MDDDVVSTLATVISAGQKAMDLAKEEGRVRKIETPTPAPKVAPRKKNPAADDPEAVDSDDVDEAEADKAPSGDDTNDGGGEAEDSPETAVPAAEVGDNPTPADNSASTGHSDGQADGPSEADPVTTSGASGIGDGNAATDRKSVV